MGWEWAAAWGPAALGAGGLGAGEGDDPGFGGNPPGGSGGDDEEGEDDEPTYVETRIRPTMLSPEVRQRITANKEEDDRYFVSTSSDPDADSFVKVPQPQKDSGLLYGEYLKYARPSEWCESITVKIETRDTDVFAGKAEKPRTVKVNSREFEVGEPTIDLVTSKMSGELATRVPAKRQVYRGDALDFFAPAYVQHPVNWQVLVAENQDRNLEGAGKYQFEFLTNHVVVDAIASEELELKSSSDKKDFFTPTEVLVMDIDGNFRVSNQQDDQSWYRNSLFMEDETNTIGKRKKREDEEDSGFPGGRGGAPGGLGGGELGSGGFGR